MATDTYDASGILRGQGSGRRYAFFTIFAKDDRIFSVLNTDLYVFALLDLKDGRYDTASAFDLRPDRAERSGRARAVRPRVSS